MRQCNGYSSAHALGYHCNVVPETYCITIIPMRRRGMCSHPGTTHSQRLMGDAPAVIQRARFGCSVGRTSQFRQARVSHCSRLHEAEDLAPMWHCRAFAICITIVAGSAADRTLAQGCDDRYPWT